MSPSSKLSPFVDLHLSELAPGENPVVSVMVRIKGHLTSEYRAQIEALGGQHVEDLAGDIIATEVPSRALPRLAELDFIVYIELPTPLYPESENNE